MNTTNKSKEYQSFSFEPKEILAYLSSSDRAIQLKVVSAINRQLVSRTRSQAEVFVNDAVVVKLNSLLDPSSENNENIVPTALRALGQIPKNLPHLTDCVVSDQLVEYLAVYSLHVRLRKPVAMFVANLCRKNQAPLYVDAVHKLLPVLRQLIQSEDARVLVCALWALSNLTDGRNEVVEMSVEDGMVPRLVTLLSHTDIEVQMPALRCCGNVLSDNRELLMRHFSGSSTVVLGHLVAMLKHSNERLVQETFRFLSKLAVGTAKPVKVIFDAGLVPLMVGRLSSVSTGFPHQGGIKTLRHAALAVKNVMKICHESQMQHLIYECDLIPSFCNLLYYEDPQVVEASLGGILTLLRTAAPGTEREFVIKRIRDCEGLGQLKKIMDGDLRKASSEIGHQMYYIMSYYFSDQVLGIQSWLRTVALASGI